MMATEEIGDVIFQEIAAAEPGKLRIRAMKISAVTVVAIDFLAQVLTGDMRECQVIGDLLVLELENGVWIYRLGEFNADHRGIIARLVEGDVLESSE